MGTTSVALPLLASARVASPCSMRWEDMSPVGEGDRQRHCSACNLSVHNFAELTGEEVEATLTKILGGERVCGRIYQRADGTILTRDCPVGVSAARARMARIVTRVAAVVAMVLTGKYLAARVFEPNEVRGFAARLLSPFHYVAEKLDPSPMPVQTIAGDICIMPGAPPIAPKPPMGPAPAEEGTP